jgi:hypothetical protein
LADSRRDEFCVDLIDIWKTQATLPSARNNCRICQREVLRAVRLRLDDGHGIENRKSLPA